MCVHASAPSEPQKSVFSTSTVRVYAARRERLSVPALRSRCVNGVPRPVTDSARPVRVLRVIARLNVGGPALHVSYLTRGLAARGYETTLVAGDVGRGEESMGFVAAREGVEVVRLPGLSRELSPLHDAVATWRLARII